MLVCNVCRLKKNSQGYYIGIGKIAVEKMFYTILIDSNIVDVK